VGANIDTLHTVVNEAVARKARGELGQDVWKDLLEPHMAICARTAPLLEAEAKRLREMLKNVRRVILSLFLYYLLIFVARRRKFWSCKPIGRQC
jgi:hypothetical protein